MEYSISRFEKNKDHDGNIVSIFLAVSVSDGTNSSYWEHWLQPSEMESVLLDEANLKPILIKCFAEAELKMENEVATRPMPSEKPLEVEGKKATLEALVKAKDITTEKIAIKAKIEADKLLEVIP
jgi:hypothetical protein